MTPQPTSPEVFPCPMCGHPVRLYSGDEGTNSYEPVEAEAAAAAEAASSAVPTALLRALVEALGEPVYDRLGTVDFDWWTKVRDAEAAARAYLELQK